MAPAAVETVILCVRYPAVGDSRIGSARWTFWGTLPCPQAPGESLIRAAREMGGSAWRKKCRSVSVGTREAGPASGLSKVLRPARELSCGVLLEASLVDVLGGCSGAVIGSAGSYWDRWAVC